MLLLVSHSILIFSESCLLMHAVIISIANTLQTWYNTGTRHTQKPQLIPRHYQPFLTPYVTLYYSLKLSEKCS